MILDKVTIRFNDEEGAVIQDYLTRNHISNKSGFFKDHFWRSFLQTGNDSLDETLKKLADACQRMERTAQQNQQLLLLVKDIVLLDTENPEINERLKRIQNFDW